MPPKKKRTVKKSEAAVDPPPSTVDPEVTTDGDDAEVPASNTQARKNRKKPKKPTPAKRAAQLAAVKAAFKDQAPIKTQCNATVTLTHAELAVMYPKYRVVLKEDYGKYITLPRNMREGDSVLLCTVCSEKGITGKHFHATHNVNKLYEHMKHHPECMKTPKRVKQTEAEDDMSGDEVPEGGSEPGLRNALARAILRSGVSIKACKRFLDEIAPYLRTEADSSAPKLSADQLRSFIDDFVEDQDKEMAERFKLIDHFALSFDGGTSKVFGLHIMVILVYTYARKYALPVIYKDCGATWTGAHISDTIIASLRKYNIGLEKVRIIVMDGATYNFVAVSGLNFVIDIVDALEQGRDVDSETYESIEITKTPEWLHGLQSAVRDNGLVSPIEILCRGHMVKTRINHAMAEVDWNKTASFHFVKLVCQSLHNVGGSEAALARFYSREVG